MSLLAIALIIIAIIGIIASGLVIRQILAGKKSTVTDIIDNQGRSTRI